MPWLPAPENNAENPADLFDLVEVLYDFAAFPRSRSFHRWDNCGWHHLRFAVGTTDLDRQQLTEQIATRDDLETGDRVRHAVSLLRSRSFTAHDTPSACITLAGVLEERRNLLYIELLSKNEGALFQIATPSLSGIKVCGSGATTTPLPRLDVLVLLSTIEVSDRLLARVMTI